MKICPHFIPLFAEIVSFNLISQVLLYLYQQTHNGQTKNLLIAAWKLLTTKAIQCYKYLPQMAINTLTVDDFPVYLHNETPG